MNEINFILHPIDGFISTLHTFGRSNNWNVHIHALVAEMAIGDNTTYRKVNFFLFLKNILVKRNLELLKIRFILIMIMDSM